MRSRRLAVAPALAAALLACLAPRLAAQRQLQPFFELGIASATDPAVAELLREIGQQSGELRQQVRMLPPPLQQMFAQLDRRILPLRVHAYVPAGWNRGAAAEPDSFWVLLDTADELPLRDWLTLGAPARPGAAAPTMVPIRELKVEHGQRWLIGKEAASLPAIEQQFAGGQMPTMHVARARLRDTLRKSPAYLFFDLAGVLGAAELAELQQFGGPTGTAFGFGVSRSRGQWNVDLHWNLRKDQGLAGSLMPAGQPAPTLHERLPWAPGVMLQANLGAFFPSVMREFGAADDAPPQARELVEAFLASWTGEFGVYVPDPKPGQPAPRGRGAPEMPPVDELVLMFRTDPRQGEKLIAAAETSLGALLGDGQKPRRDELGRLAFANGPFTVLADQRDGIFAIAATLGDAARAGQTLEQVLRAPSGKPAARIDSELDGQLQLTVSPAFGARLVPLLRSLTDDARNNMLAGMALPMPVAMLHQNRQQTFAKLARGFGVSLRADDEGLRLRCRQ